MSAADAQLERAIAQLRARRPAGALDTLLRSWRATPRTTIADRIDTLSAWIAPAVPPIQGRNPSHTSELWLTIAGDGRAIDQPRLAAMLGVPPFTRVARRLEWLIAQAPDPRWTTPLVGFMRKALMNRQPFGTGRSRARASRTAFKVLLKGQDRRAVALLGQRAGHLGPDVERWVERLDAKLPEDTTLPEAQLIALDAALAEATSGPPPALDVLTAGGDGRTEAQLLAMIYDAPDDLDARRVYADWLEASGSPRAEFMRLQLKRIDGRFLKKDGKREAALIARHQLGWLGPLAPFMRDVEWDLGFPSAATVKFRGRKQRDASLADPAWRTLTELHTTHGEILSHPHLANVRQLGRRSPFLGVAYDVTPLDIRLITHVADTLPCERLVLEAARLGSLNLSKLPALSSLDLVFERYVVFGKAHWRRLTDALAARATWKRVAAWYMATGGWLSIVERHPSVDRLELVLPWGFRYAVSNGPDGRHLDIVWGDTRPCEDFGHASGVAARLAPFRVRVHTPGYNHPADVLARWREMLTAPEVEMPRPRRGTG